MKTHNVLPDRNERENPHANYTRGAFPAISLVLCVGLLIPLINFIYVLYLNEQSLPSSLSFVVCVYFCYRGSPHTLKMSVGRAIGLTAIALSSMLGIMTQQLTLLAMSSLAWVWVCFQHKHPATRPAFIHAVFLAAMSIPWLTSETLIAWVFRLGSAQSVESWWLLMGYPIERTGTLLSINNQHVDVTAACSGMEQLSTLIIGATLILYQMTHSWKQLSRNLVLIILVAWISNTLRLALLTYAVDTWSINTIKGLGHDSIGYLSLLFSLVIVWTVSRSINGTQQAMTYFLWLTLAMGPMSNWLQTTLVTPQAHLWAIPLLCCIPLVAIIVVWRNAPIEPFSAALIYALLMLAWISDLAVLGQIAILLALCNTAGPSRITLGIILSFASQIPILRHLEQGTWFTEAALLITGSLLIMVSLIRRKSLNRPATTIPMLKASYYQVLPLALGIGILSFGQSNLLKNISSAEAQFLTEVMVPLKGFGFKGEDIPLDTREQTFYRNNRVMKRWYQTDNMGFLLIHIDGTTNQDALHDPAFCLEAAGWSIMEEKQISLPSGAATQVVAHRGAEQRQITWWFNDGHQRYSGLMSLQLQALAYRFGLRGAVRPSLTIIQDPPNGRNDIEDIFFQIPALTSL